MGDTDIARRSEEPAGGDPRRGGGTAGWLLIVLALFVLLLWKGWIPVLMVILAVFCIGFILTRQKRDERRDEREARSDGPRRN